MSDGSARKRRRHIDGQSSKCHYCRRRMNDTLRELRPVLEHFEPRSSSHKPKVTVAACTWCDKAKGMMPGVIFMMLIEVKTCGRSFGAAMQDISREAKSINYRLHRAHEAVVVAKLRKALRGLDEERASP